MPVTNQPTPVFQAPPTGAPPPSAPPPNAPLQTPQQGAVPPQGAPPPPPPPSAPTPPGAGIPPPVPPLSGVNKKLLFIVIGIVVVILLIIIGIFSFVRSSSSSNGEEGKVELTYWGFYQDPKVMQMIIDDFQRENPNITVKFVQQDVNQYRDRLVTRIKSGTGPDIFRYHNTWVPMLRGVLLPLSQEAITPKEFEDAYYNVVATDLIQNGGIIGVPLSIDTLALFTNDQMFTSQGLQVPATWQDFVTVAAALTTRDDKGQITTSGAALGTYDNVTHSSDLISLFLAQGGVDVRDIGKTPTEAQEALQFYTIFAKGGDDMQKVWDGKLEPSGTAFVNGRLAMYFGYSWDLFTIKALNPGLAFSVHQVPQLRRDKRAIASYWVEGVSSSTKYPQSAMKFMKFLHQKETQQKYYTEVAKVRNIGSPYARRDLGGTLKSEPMLYPFVQQAEYAVSTPFVRDTQDNGLNEKVNEYLKAAVDQLNGNTSPETVVQTLDQGVKQSYAQYGQ